MSSLQISYINGAKAASLCGGYWLKVTCWLIFLQQIPYLTAFKEGCRNFSLQMFEGFIVSALNSMHADG